MVSAGEQDELRRLLDENARLKALLNQHGITWEEPHAPESAQAPPEPVPATNQFSTADKIALFRRLFRGREDVYPQRWEMMSNTALSSMAAYRRNSERLCSPSWMHWTNRHRESCSPPAA